MKAAAGVVWVAATPIVCGAAVFRWRIAGNGLSHALVVLLAVPLVTTMCVGWALGWRWRAFGIGIAALMLAAALLLATAILIARGLRESAG